MFKGTLDVTKDFVSSSLIGHFVVMVFTIVLIFKILGYVLKCELLHF